MLIPSIDLQGGRIVQLVQGERLAVSSDDLEGWLGRFQRFPELQLIDLDAAKGEGSNDALVREIAGRRRCRVGGGVRTVERAQALLEAGASAVIVGSSLFSGNSVDTAFAEALAAGVGRERVIAAVDARAGQVTIHGWRTTLNLTAVDAVRALEPYCSGFLYTVVDREGLLGGTDLSAIQEVAAATTRRVTAAGGITTREEIESLDAMGVDAVVGMAIYTGALLLDDLR